MIKKLILTFDRMSFLSKWSGAEIRLANSKSILKKRFAKVEEACLALWLRDSLMKSYNDTVLMRVPRPRVI